MAKEAAPEPTPEPPKGKKKKILLIVIVAVSAVVLLGGGAVVYLLTSKPAAEQRANADEEGHAEEEAPTVYERLETFTVNLADQDSYLQVEISLKVADSKVQDKIKARMPEVRDALLRLLSSKTVEELSMREGKENLAKEVAKEINALIGAKDASSGVKGVLFTAFIIQ